MLQDRDNDAQNLSCYQWERIKDKDKATGGECKRTYMSYPIGNTTSTMSMFTFPPGASSGSGYVADGTPPLMILSPPQHVCTAPNLDRGFYCSAGVELLSHPDGLRFLGLRIVSPHAIMHHSVYAYVHLVLKERCVLSATIGLKLKEI